MSAETPQRRALPGIVARILDASADSGIVLQGSVQEGRERPDSDIDLTVVVPDAESLVHNELIAPDNRWGMTRVVWPDPEVNVDINWMTAADLLRVYEGPGGQEWFLYAHGEIMADAAGLAARCQERGRRFWAENPVLADAWREQNEKVRRAKEDLSVTLEFPTWADFSKHLRTL